jgi:hypothetical protein
VTYLAGRSVEVTFQIAAGVIVMRERTGQKQKRPARHIRTYDRHQLVLDPAHQEAVLKIKRKAFHSTPGGRLEQAVPESKTLLDLAFAQGESARPSDRPFAEAAGAVWRRRSTPRHRGSSPTQHAACGFGIPASPSTPFYAASVNI